MKAGASKRTIRIAVVESDPLRFIGLKSLFDTETDLELVSCSLAELGPRKDIDLVLLGTRAGQNLFDVMAGLKAARPDLRIIVTGSGADDETILKALAAGAKGYVMKPHPQRSLSRPCGLCMLVRSGPHVAYSPFLSNA